MPYKRRTTTYRKRYTRTRKLNYRQKRQVKQIIGKQIEDKCFSFGGQDTGVSNTGVVHDMSNLATSGTGENQRVGRKIGVKRFMINFEVQTAQSSFISPDAWNTVRIILFRWRITSSAATPVMNDILDNTSSLTNYSTQWPHNFNTDKFKVIYDKTIKVGPMPVYDGANVEYYAVGPNAQRVMKWKFYGKRLGNKTIHFDNDVNGHGKEKIYALFTTDSTVSPHPIVNWTGQLVYEDA